MTSHDDTPHRSESSWFGGRYLWDSPRVRKEKTACGNYIEEPLHEDWLELFTDLMLVAFYMRLSAGFALAGWQHGLALLACFISFWNLFHGMYAMTTFINMFDSDCLARLVFLSLIPLGICISVLNVKVDEETHVPDTDTVLGFAVGFALQRVGLAILYLQVWWSVSGMGSVPAIIGFGFAFSIFISEAARWFTTDPWCLTGAHFLVALNELLSKALAIRRQKGQASCLRFLKPATRNVGVHIGHIQARTGIAVMVALGESIIQLLNSQYHEGFEEWRLHFTLGGFLLTFALAMIYFDSQPHSIEGHVLRLSSNRAITHRFVFPFLIFSIWVIGAAFELVLANGQHVDEHVTPEHGEPGSEHPHTLVADPIWASLMPWKYSYASAPSPWSSQYATSSTSASSHAASAYSRYSNELLSDSTHPARAESEPSYDAWMVTATESLLQQEQHEQKQERGGEEEEEEEEQQEQLQQQQHQKHQKHQKQQQPPLEESAEATPVRRLSHSAEWTLDASCMLFSISIGVTHILMTWARHVHTGLAGLKTTSQQVRAFIRVCIGVSHCFVFLVVKQLGLSPSMTALSEVWGHILLTIPMIVSTLRFKGSHEHGHDHEHGGGSDEHCQHDSSLMASFRSITQVGSQPSEDFYPDPFTHKIEDGVDIDEDPDETVGGGDEEKPRASAGAGSSSSNAPAAAAVSALASHTAEPPSQGEERPHAATTTTTTTTAAAPAPAPEYKDKDKDKAEKKKEKHEKQKVSFSASPPS
mmetsp:Transcript_19082/g.41071  ORF Transcript_19082/g.41071 Transcript_19082/m.41071 type:complete len:758 (-) Transcript_19082:76-2349(-)